MANSLTPAEEAEFDQWASSGSQGETCAGAPLAPLTSDEEQLFEDWIQPQQNQQITAMTNAYYAAVRHVFGQPGCVQIIEMLAVAHVQALRAL